MTYILWTSDFALYPWVYLKDKHNTFGYLLSFKLRVTSYFCRSLCPIHVFHGPVILPFICDRIKYEGIILWILVQSDSVNDVILFAGHCDLFFMVQ